MARPWGFDPAESSVDRFNRLLGNKTNRPWPQPGTQQVTSRPQAGTTTRLSQVATGSRSIPSSISRAHRHRMNLMGGTSAPQIFDQSTIDEIWQNQYDRIAQEYVQNATENQAIHTAQQAVDDEEGGRSWLGTVWNAVSGGLLTGNPANPMWHGTFQSSPLGRTLDILSRPAYGTFEAFRRYEQDLEVDSGAKTFGDFFAGLWGGLSGQNKTGAGQVYEAYKNQDLPVGHFLQTLEREHPAIESWVSRYAGGAGELVGDPLNYVMPARPAVMAGGAVAERAGVAGRVADSAVMERMMRQIVEETVSDYAAMTPTISRIYANNPGAFVNRIMDRVSEMYANSVLNVQGGGMKGARLMNNRTWPETVAAAVRAEAEESTTRSFWDMVTGNYGVARVGNPSAGYVKRVLSNIAANDDYDRFWTELTDYAKAQGYTTTGNVDEVLTAVRTGRISSSRIVEIANNTVDRYTPDLQRLFDDVVENTSHMTYRTVGVRVGGRVVPARAVGRAYHWVNNRTLGKVFPNMGGVADSVLFESRFPGIFGGKVSRARALAFNSFDDFRNTLSDVMNGVMPGGHRISPRAFTLEEANELQRALVAGTPSLGDPAKDAALTWLRDTYRRMWYEELKYGTRPASGISSRFADRYAYRFLKGGSSKERQLFANGRREAMHLYGNEGIYTHQYAIDKGLKPIENAFDNVMMRYVKSRRDIMRGIFLEDLLDNYAVLPLNRPGRRLPSGVSKAAHMHLVDPDVLPQNYRQMLNRVWNKGNKGFYLPDTMWELYSNFVEMSKWSTQEWNSFGRAWATAINKIKGALTLPSVGFHVRNNLGDMFMGLMDDIPLRRYPEVIQKWKLNQMGRTQYFHVFPGYNMPYDEMYLSFRQNAKTGFITTDLSTFSSHTGGSIPKNFMNVPRRSTSKVVGVLKKVSDMRENWGRFVHYSEAFQQEARALYKAGMRDPAEIIRQAERVATWRVNQYKFDYAALLPFEQKLKTLVFPFYTYSRKAIPALLGQMFVNPHYMSTFNRVLLNNEKNTTSKNFDAMNIPQWQRDTGVGVLTDEAEPWVMTSDIFPLGTMDLLSANDPREFFNNLLAKINPVMQAPIEYGTGQQIFEDRPIPENMSMWDYIVHNTPIVGDIQDEVLDPIRGDSPKSIMERLLNERMFGAGLPIRKDRAQQLAQQQQENRDTFIDDPLRDFNNGQDRYRIGVTNEFTYTITDQITGEKLPMEFMNPTSAIDFAKQLPGANWQQEFIDPRQMPSDQLVNQSLQ